MTGTGKTTLARRIALATGLPLVEVDELTWEPGWTEVPLEEQRRRVAKAVAGDSWVMDSAYGKWLDLVLPRVELVVGLDYPRWLSFGWLVRRTVHRWAVREPCCNGNYEGLGNMVGPNSIWAWHFKSWSRKRERIRAWAKAGEPKTVVLRGPGEVAGLLKRLQACDHGQGW